MNNISDDEWRLLHLFRCLSPSQRHEALRDTYRKAMARCIPDKGIYELMPDAAGVEPEDVEFIDDPYFVCHVIYSGMEETGDPSDYLLGTSDWDEEYVVPRFVYGAGRAALEQRCFFNYNEDFARDYIRAWRWEIVTACERN